MTAGSPANNQTLVDVAALRERHHINGLSHSAVVSLLDEIERLRAEVERLTKLDLVDSRIETTSERMRAEKAERERDEARAACAAKDAAIRDLRSHVGHFGLPEDVGDIDAAEDERTRVMGRGKKALALDAGKGWCPPEVAEQMAAALEHAAAVLREVLDDTEHGVAHDVQVSKLEAAIDACEKAVRR